MNTSDLKTVTRRRTDLMDFMAEGVAIIPTANEQPRNGDTVFPYRPDSDFYYLTRFPEPDAVAVLIPGNPDGEFILFCRPRDPEKETWDGHRYGLEGGRDVFAADQVHPIDQIEELLPKLLENRSKVFASMGRHNDFDHLLISSVNEVREKQRSGVSAPVEFVDLGHILHEMRLFKKPDEIKRMKKAAAISVEAHRRAMQVCRPGLYEYQVQAELEYVFRHGGCASNAYSSIVAGGKNACTLHYIQNSQSLNDGDLVLIDAGAEYDCYASDVTRTFPVNGKFSAAQKSLYEVVLAAQKAAIDVVKPDQAVTCYHEVSSRILCEGMLDLGLLSGELDELYETGAYKRFSVHRAGHWLGMDVHDVGDYKVDEDWRILEAGMVLTVEPGIYIDAADDIDARWQNIGIRIEDNILVTRQGNDNLNKDLVREVDDIEALMAG